MDILEVNQTYKPLHAEQAIQVILGCPHLLLNYQNKVINVMNT